MARRKDLAYRADGSIFGIGKFPMRAIGQFLRVAATPGYFGLRLRYARSRRVSVVWESGVDFPHSEQFARTVFQFSSICVAHFLLDVLEVGSDGLATDAQLLCDLTRPACRSNQREHGKLAIAERVESLGQIRAMSESLDRQRSNRRTRINFS